MPVELRKRKAREPPAPPPAPAKKRTPAAKTGKAAAAAKAKAAPAKAPGKRGRPAKAKVEEEPAKEEEEKKEEEKVEEEKEEEKAEEKVEEPKEAKKKSDKAEVGDVVDLDGFGGEIETNDGEKTTLKALVDESKAGVVLFTYPKASTPGCTKQVCFFRDSYEPLTAGGLAIYGLSTDSPKANTTFKDKQKLPYPLLCDPKATLIGAIGLKKAPKGTQRGVFVIDKEGKVLVAEPGSPQGTVDRVKKLVEELAA
ncbi:Thioredoxin domain-containing protein [Fusarium sp. LHS14.1]|nr:Thioredoxin domain-containing protein [Fusarium sp. LHS14.1]